MKNEGYILADRTLAHVATYFPAWPLSYYTDLATLHDLLPHHRILLCRTTLKINAALPIHTLRYILTASSGVDHIDLPYVSQQGIQVFDAKGVNARAVCHYVLAVLTYLKKQAFDPKTIGIIGLGAIGSKLRQCLVYLGYQIIGYDPFLQIGDLENLIQCDCICIHANLHDTLPYPSRNLLNAAFFKQCSPNMCIINVARGGIVNEDDLLTDYAGLYCTDVYLNEPYINPAIVERATICTPHIAGRTREAKKAIMYRLSMQLHTALNISMPHIVLSHDVIKPMSYDLYLETQALKVNPKHFIKLRQIHLRSEQDYLPECVLKAWSVAW